MADAGDLKSPARFGCVGSNPTSANFLISKNLFFRCNTTGLTRSILLSFDTKLCRKLYCLLRYIAETGHNELDIIYPLKAGRGKAAIIMLRV